MKSGHILVLIALLLFSGCKDNSEGQATVNEPTLNEQLLTACKNAETTPEAISILIQAGAEVNARDKNAFTQVRCNQEREQNISTRPPHQIDRSIHAKKGNQTSHRNERRGTHPVRCGRHPICYWRDMLACNVELAC